jgi:hypothetical protein
LHKVNVDVAAQQSGHGHLSNALQLLARESQILVTRLVEETIAELPIAKLLTNDTFKSIDIKKIVVKFLE